MIKRYISFAASVAIMATVITGCNEDNTVAVAADKAVAATKVEFIGMDAPKTYEEMSKTYSTAKARVYTSDTEYKDYPLSYNVLFGVKDKVGKNPNAAGQLYDYKMKPLMDPDGKPLIAETPDSNSLLNVGGKLFLVSHLEYDWILSNGTEAYKQPNWYSRSPMNMILTNIEQDVTTGKLKAVDQKPIDHSSVEGGWILCFGSQTPWNTHLGGEEDYDLYFTEASGTKNNSIQTNGLKAMTEQYWNNTKQANPYSYGYLKRLR